MKDNSLVSIVTPSYNQGEFIEHAILSIKAQTYPHIEHIIVDAGSSDQTLDVLRQHEGTYNMRWICEPDQGMYDAINKGFRIASGEIFAYLNCDDYYLPWTVATAIQHLLEHKIIFGDAIRRDLDGYDTYLASTPPFIHGYYLSKGIIIQPTVFFRREVFERIGEFDATGFRLMADCDYWLRCAATGLYPHKVYEFLAVETTHAATQRSKYRDQLYDELVKLRQKYPGPMRRSERLIYVLVKYFYWRLALLAYKSGWRSLWPILRHSDAVKLSWIGCILELLPRRLRHALRPRVRIDWQKLCEGDNVRSDF